jgi:hypothetical protein
VDSEEIEYIGILSSFLLWRLSAEVQKSPIHPITKSPNKYLGH